MVVEETEEVHVGMCVKILGRKYQKKITTIVSLMAKMVYIDIKGCGRKRIMKYNIKPLFGKTVESDDDDETHVVGMHVQIKWAHDIFDGIIFLEEGKMGAIVKVTQCYVWVLLDGSHTRTQEEKQQDTFKKQKHNVTIILKYPE